MHHVRRLSDYTVFTLDLNDIENFNYNRNEPDIFVNKPEKKCKSEFGTSIYNISYKFSQ